MSGRISIIGAVCITIPALTILPTAMAGPEGCIDCVPSPDPPCCETVVLGGPVVNETWTKANSPYCIEGDITVSVLTIEPGVCVKINGPYRINVVTTIDAKGTEEEPITFTAGVSGVRWKGLWFEDTPPGSNLTHCIIQWSDEAGIILVNNNPPVLNNCIIRNNTHGAGNGGGIRAFIDEGDLNLTGCTISSNRATVHGGGIYAVMGSGTLRLEDCIIAHNQNNSGNASGSYQGGGIRVEGNSYFKRCLIKKNTCTSVCTNAIDRWARGGGIYVLSGNAVFENCVLQENLARTIWDGCSVLGHRYAQGGGIYINAGSLALRTSVLSCNSLVAANTKRGGGLYVAGGTVDVINSSIARNTQEGIYRSGGTVNVRNSIVWDNGGAELDGTIKAEYSCIQGTPVYPGIGNINFSRAFKGPGCCLHDIEILPGSPCIDAGDPNRIYDDVCLPPSQGTARNDIGAHGGPLACDWGCMLLFEDVNGDGTVGILDLLSLLAAWGSCPADPQECPADINCDGTVGILDLLELLAGWGQTC